MVSRAEGARITVSLNPTLDGVKNSSEPTIGDADLVAAPKLSVRRPARNRCKQPIHKSDLKSDEQAEGDADHARSQPEASIKALETPAGEGEWST